MKRFIVLLIGIMMIVGLAACKKDGKTIENPEYFNGSYKLTEVIEDGQSTEPRLNQVITFKDDGKCYLNNGIADVNGTYEKTGTSIRVLLNMGEGYKESWLMYEEDDKLIYEASEPEYDDNAMGTGNIIQVKYIYERG